MNTYFELNAKQQANFDDIVKCISHLTYKFTVEGLNINVALSRIDKARIWRIIGIADIMNAKIELHDTICILYMSCCNIYIDMTYAGFGKIKLLNNEIFDLKVSREQRKNI